MEKKEFEGKLYNYTPTNTPCPTITINGKPYCVMKDCYIRAILRAQNWDCHTLPRDGNQPIEEAPPDWKQRCDFLVERGAKPDCWI